MESANHQATLWRLTVEHWLRCQNWIAIGQTGRQSRCANYTRLFIAIVVMSLGISGLAQMPGSVVKVTTSKLDGERQVQIEPASLKGEKMSGRPPKVGGFWSDKSPTNFTLEAVLFGDSRPETLRIRIDGSVSEFPATNGTRVITSITVGEKVIETASRAIVPLSFVQEMVAGTNVVIQVENARGFTEGVFSSDAATRARPRFKEALKRIQDLGTGKSNSSPSGKSVRERPSQPDDYVPRWVK